MIGNAVQEGNVFAQTTSALMKEVGMICKNLQTLLSYDWLCVQLVYTQTVALAKYIWSRLDWFSMPATHDAYEKYTFCRR